MDVGKLTVALLVLFCGIAHGRGGLDVNRVASGVLDSGHAVSVATGRALKGLRRMQKEIEAQSLEDSSWSRRILQDKGGLCMWEDGKCDLSPRSLLLLLEDSDSPVAQLGKNFLQCKAHRDEKSCSAEKCTWEFGECSSSSDLFSAALIDDCLGDFAPLARIGFQGNTCSEENSSAEECDAEDICAWDGDDDECSADIWKALLQIPSENGMPKGMNEALSAMQESLTSAAFTDMSFILNSDPSAFLDWVPPSFECPADVDQKVCDFVAPARELFGITLYCSRKHEEGGPGCEADPLCADEGGECEAASTVTAEILQKQMKTVVSSFQDPGVQDVFLQVVSCGMNTKETCVEACAWNALEVDCEVNDSWLSRRMAEESIKSEKAICKMFSGYMQLGCQNVELEACSGNPKCEWDSDVDDCEARDSAMVRIALEADPELSGALSFHQECAAVTKKRACLSL